jgi:hypothetical protein
VWASCQKKPALTSTFARNAEKTSTSLRPVLKGTFLLRSLLADPALFACTSDLLGRLPGTHHDNPATSREIALTSKYSQKYSRYIPVYDQQHGKARKSSDAKDSDKASGRDKDRSSRASVDSFGKRRSTMNSRAAYDEDEVLRKVIEESKHEGPQTEENGSRKKRSREDSEE